ncbi:serine/threonine-protein kinase [Actinomadura flavalba]|uniref:serine/threonine-protein kinase n=1 Tax=Actinomadura flavalba TaxID=1120938 RepID=UPI00039A0E29|nr:serine/threonine-protein kinase [Actinomadura flavalba]
MPAPVPVFEPLVPGDPPALGAHRVLARLGVGEMGRVYLAVAPDGGKLAVKVIRPEFAADADFVRLLGAAVADARRVRGRFVAPVLDADTVTAPPWVASAHVAGPSLAEMVVSLGPLPEPTVRVLFAAAAEALTAVHAAGVVHRDLKPSNVLLAPDGPRVLDFGFAGAADALPLAGSGIRAGAPQFMAPEQARGEDATPAVDVFALASVVAFAATGRTPFGDGAASAVLYRVVHEEPDLSGCPDALLPLLERCLSKEPSQRPDPADIRTELGLPDDLTGWLPEDVTRRLGAYSADPPRPMGPPTSGPGFDGPPVPPPLPPPPAQPKASPARIIAAICAVAVGLLLVAAVLVVVMLSRGGGDDQLPSDAATSAPSTEPPSSSTPAEAPGGSGNEVGRYQDINLPDGYGLAFGGDPARPAPSHGDPPDLRYIGRVLYANRVTLLPPTAPGSFAVCTSRLPYQRHLEVDRLAPGSRFCVTSVTGLVALVNVQGVGPMPGSPLTLDVTVWEGSPPTPGN